MITKNEDMTSFENVTINTIVVTAIIKFKAIFLFFTGHVMSINADLGKLMQDYSTVVDVIVKTIGAIYIITKLYILMRDKVFNKKPDTNDTNETNNSNND